MVVNYSKIITLVGILLILLDTIFFYGVISSNVSGVLQAVEIFIGDIIFFGALECFWRSSQGTW
jgi:hypothetical protein